MTDDTVPPAEGIDASRPSVARMYDYYLGGKDNYAVDRAAADTMMSAVPESKRMVQANRAFLAQAVHYLTAEVGIRQFLDIGSGLPTRQNVHEVAQAVAPESRVVYVDHDLLAAAHGRALLANGSNTAFIHGDLLRPEAILENSKVRSLIDFDEPVAILIVAILHFVSDDAGPGGILNTLRQAIVPGSHLAISHVLDDPRTHAIGKILTASGAPAWFPRTRAEILRFFEGFDLLEPGLSVLPRWRPLIPAPASLCGASGPSEDLGWQVAGIGRKR